MFGAVLVRQTQFNSQFFANFTEVRSQIFEPADKIHKNVSLPIRNTLTLEDQIAMNTPIYVFVECESFHQTMLKMRLGLTDITGALN